MKWILIVIFLSAAAFGQNAYGPDYLNLHCTTPDPNNTNPAFGNTPRPGLAPSTSANGSAVLYCDAAIGSLKISFNGGTYNNLAVGSVIVGLADSTNSPVSSGNYTSQSTDCGKLIRFISGAGASPVIPLSSGAGLANCQILLSDENAGTLTFGRTGADTFTLNGTTGLTSFTLASGARAQIGQTPAGVWQVNTTPNATLSGIPTAYRIQSPISITATSSPGTTIIQTGAGTILANTFYDVDCDFTYSESVGSTLITLVGTESNAPASPGWWFGGFIQITGGGGVDTLAATINTPATTNAAFTIGADTPTDTLKHPIHLRGTIPGNASSNSQFTISAFIAANTLVIQAGGCSFTVTAN